MIGWFLVALLAPSVVQAQVQSWSDFSGGLNTRTSSVLLPDNESPNLSNVVLDENGAITRRKGYSKLNAAALGDGFDVNSVYQLEQSDGDKYCVAFSSTNGYYSIDGCQTFTSFVSTLTRNNDVNCDAYGDNLYCVNNQYNFYFDGANDITVSSAPTDLNYIRVWRNRCFGAGKDTNPSRLYWSNLGSCSYWTPTQDYVDIDAEDGDVITGIGPDLFNFLPVYKKFSTYLIQFDNANPTNRKVVNVSRSTGAKNHRSILNYNNRQYFSSVGPYGGQPGIYSTDGIMVAEDTTKLRTSVDALSNYYSNIGRKTLDTKADWDAGVFDAYAMSSARDAGFMQSSYTAPSMTTSADWSAGTLVNLSTTDISGSVTLSSSVAQDNFGDGNYTTGSTTWTVVSGAFSVANSWLTATSLNNSIANKVNTSQVKIASGSWAFDTYYYNSRAGGYSYCGGLGAICFQFYFAKAQNGDSYRLQMADDGYYSSPKIVSLVQNVSGVDTISTSAVTAAINTGVYSWGIVISTVGYAKVYLNGAQIMVGNLSGVSTSVGADLALYSESYVLNYVSNIYAYNYRKDGTYTSQIFDTAISTPIGGQLSSTATVNSDYQINFYTRQSSMSNNTAWSSWTASSDTLRIDMSQRYQQVKAEFNTSISTKTPHLDALSFQAASTGTWTSGELFLSNTMTGFGTFQTNQTTTGSGASISYAMRISTYAGGTATTSTGTISVTPGSSIAHSSGCYVVVGATFTIYSATETSKLDTITINWNEGTAAKSATMAVYKNRLHFCGQTSTSTYNDVCYVRDASGAWVKWSGVRSRNLNVVSGNLVSGEADETRGGYLYKLYDTDSDNGGAINAYWESKDHILGKIQNVKAVDRLYLIGSPDATILTATLKADTGLRSAAYDINFSTGMTFKISNKVIDRSLNGNVFRLRFENNAASKPWSVLGYGLLYRDLGMMQP